MIPDLPFDDAYRCPQDVPAILAGSVPDPEPAEPPVPPRPLDDDYRAPDNLPAPRAG